MKMNVKNLIITPSKNTKFPQANLTKDVKDLFSTLRSIKC